MTSEHTIASVIDALDLPEAGRLSPAWPADGMAGPELTIKTKTIGINRSSELYEYGPTASEPGPLVPNNAICGVITALQVSTGSSAKYGERDYLDVRLQTPDPTLRLILKLPCGASQYSYRSLLGALLCLTEDSPITQTCVRLGAKAGHTATFISLALDPQGTQIIRGQALEPGRDALEIAVNRLRQALGQSPQFL